MISKYSVAVLPFTDTGPDKDRRYLSDGMSMEIIHALSRYKELQVTSRYSSSRFTFSGPDIFEIRSNLNVAWLVDGHTQLSGENITVTAQLIYTEDSSMAGSFSEAGQLPDIPLLQQKIASSIASHIISNPDPLPHGTDTGTGHSEAFEEYMKGQFLLNQLESTHWKKMMGHFQKSMSLDPGFPLPMVAMCHSYAWLSSIGLVEPSEARREIDKLINKLFLQNHRISDVYQLQAEKLFWIEWKPKQALDNIVTALELNQSNSAALVMKGLVLFSLGRIEETMDALFRAERLDPYGENVKYCIGLVYRYTGEFDKAYRYVNESLEISPAWLAPYFTMNEILCMQQRIDDAERFIDRSRAVPGFSEMIPVFNGLIAAFAGRSDEALRYVNRFDDLTENEAVIAPLFYYLGLICLQVHRIDDALGWIRKGLQFRATPFLFIHIDNSWDPLRNEPAFIELIAQSGLPAPATPGTPNLKYRKSRLENKLVTRIQGNLKKALEDDRVFLDPTLSLGDLAELCDVSVNQLSQYLNGHLGKSFYDYLNLFRLNHFLEIARKRELEKMSILGLAYESGFNSKTTFNTFFKKELQATPKEYLKKGERSDP